MKGQSRDTVIGGISETFDETDKVLEGQDLPWLRKLLQHDHSVIRSFPPPSALPSFTVSSTLLALRRASVYIMNSV